MKKRMKSWLRPGLFILGGVIAGYLYNRFAGCASGTCAIASSPAAAMLYMGVIGWLLSGVFGKGCGGRCSM